MSLPIDQIHTIHARVGIQRALDIEGNALSLVPADALVHHGRVRMAVWVLMTDMAGGWDAQSAAGSDWTFTSDISVRSAARPAPQRALATSRVVRAGRSTLHTEVVFCDEHGAELGLGYAGFSRHSRREGDNPSPTLETAAARWGGYVPLDRPLFDAIGIETVDAARGEVQVELRDELRNPAGIMQGAMIAAVGEAAAEALISMVDPHPHVVTDLDMRFLAMGRRGPIVSRARFVGHNSIAVELYDRGEADRLMCTLLLRAEPIAAQGG